MRPLPSRRLAAAPILALLLALAPAARAFDTNAREAWVYDISTGTVLMEKDADVARPPASMSKLMTVYMLFEALRDGRVTPETEFTVSPKAQAMGGSRMFLEAGERVPVSVYLVNGIKLQGQIESFDQFVVLLRSTVSQMVYKHAISTVVPSRPVTLREVHEDEQPEQ